MRGLGMYKKGSDEGRFCSGFDQRSGARGLVVGGDCPLSRFSSIIIVGEES